MSRHSSCSRRRPYTVVRRPQESSRNTEYGIRTTNCGLRTTNDERRTTGFTIAEVMIATVILGIVASGTLMAFTTAGRMVREQSNPALMEATQFAQETLETVWNQVESDPAGTGWLATSADGAWHEHALPAVGTRGTESILQQGPAKRCYRIVEEDCNGNTVDDEDCYAVNVRICWDEAACATIC